MWSALWPRHPPFRCLKQGTPSAVGGRPSVICRILPGGPPTHPACSACCSLSPGLHFPAHRPPAPPWPGLGGNCNKDLESFRAPAALTAVLIGLLPPIMPGSWGPRTFPPHSLGEQQVPLRVATPPPLWAAQPRRRGHARAHSSCERPSCLHGAAEPKGSQANWEDVPEWRKAGLQEKGL